MYMYLLAVLRVRERDREREREKCTYVDNIQVNGIGRQVGIHSVLFNTLFDEDEKKRQSLESGTSS